MKLQKWHGELIGGTFVKRGSAVVKFWRENGYALPQELLLREDVKRVRLYTKYDGILEAGKEAFSDGLLHKFGNEWQVILPLNKWEVK